MASNICPVCSGEIMTYKRVLRKTEATPLEVCQCCGARLKRSGAAFRILAAALAMLVGLGAGLALLAARGTLTWLTALLLMVLGGLAMILALLMGGWRPIHWVWVDRGLSR